MAEKKRSKRFETLEQRPVHKDGFTGEWVDVGLIAMGSPNDPVPSIKIENGKVVEMDGIKRENFNMNEQFVADYAIDLDMAPKAMAMSEKEIAHKLVDINVPRTECTKIMQGLTPAKIARVMDCLNIAEIILAMQKMRTRQTPGTQAHITSATDNPIMLVADAAEGALRGFTEMETTVAVVRYAPLNALSLLIGAQVGRPGTLTQCALEEAFELQIGMRGLT
ncbi:MAG: propanediol dehydratase, partial [Synergistaceae bacterium]|nr:propanediol dehydratase [Synergistaceae bacterium]